VDRVETLAGVHAEDRADEISREKEERGEGEDPSRPLDLLTVLYMKEEEGGHGQPDKVLKSDGSDGREGEGQEKVIIVPVGGGSAHGSNYRSLFEAHEAFLPPKGGCCSLTEIQRGV
jgi:hypothetical protein